MDELIKWLVQQVPLAVVVGVALWKVYSDGRADRQYMMLLLERSYLRIKQLQGEDVDLPEATIMKRPGT